jgi:hypothetical protein
MIGDAWYFVIAFLKYFLGIYACTKIKIYTKTEKYQKNKNKIQNIYTRKPKNIITIK